jgi:hypothetical protein
MLVKFFLELQLMRWKEFVLMKETTVPLNEEKGKLLLICWEELSSGSPDRDNVQLFLLLEPPS